MPPLASRRSLSVFVLVAFTLAGAVPAAWAADPQSLSSPQSASSSSSPLVAAPGPIALSLQSLGLAAGNREARVAPADGQAPPIQPTVVPSRQVRKFHWEMLPLSATYLTLQGLDVHSTLRALDRGASEANPILAPFVGHPAALVALKATMAGTLLYSATRLSRRNRVASVLLMAGLNTFYGIVVAHNYGVARNPSR